MTPLRDRGARVCAALATGLFLALLISLLLSLLRVDQIPGYVLLALFALGALSALRPDNALLVLAGGVPIAAWLGRHWNPSVSWPETLVVAFCAGYCARSLVVRGESLARKGHARDALDAPIFLAAALVVASLAVQLLIDAWRFGGASTLADLWLLVSPGYFVTAASWHPVDAAMRLLESLVLLRAAASVTKTLPAFVPRLARWIVIGASAAAGLNLLRLWEAAERLDHPVAAFARYVMTERLNVHYADLNAAGSYFVMTLFAALGLTLGPKGRFWLISGLLIGSSIWIAGSRMAMMAGLLAMVLPAGALAGRIRRGSVRGTSLAAAAIVLTLLAAAAAYSIPERGNQRSVAEAVQTRWELARTSVRMAASSPSFGVGIGRYYSRSGEFSSPELLRLFPPAIHENAHNNFLQILAELGVAGFAVIAWLLWAATRLSARLLRADLHDPLRWGLVTGLLAFTLSWLGGHPLLIDEPAMTFWVLLGAVCGWGATLASTMSTRPSGWVLSVLILVVALSVPLRVARQRADFDLEHRGVGLSAWQDAIDGVRYRLAGSTSSVFVPSDALMITVPLRAASPSAAIRLELRLDGRPADVVNIPSDRWQLLRLRLPQERNAPRFRRLDLRVASAASSDSPLLMIGKVEPR